VPDVWGPTLRHGRGSRPAAVQQRCRYSSRSIIACPGLPCVGQIDRYLGVLDASRGTGVLALRPDRPVAA
jgi:hypothetical protein